MNAINWAHNQALTANEEEVYGGDYRITMVDDTVILEELDDIILCLDL